MCMSYLTLWKYCTVSFNHAIIDAFKNSLAFKDVTVCLIDFSLSSADTVAHN